MQLQTRQNLIGAMTTRGSLARGLGKETFQGRVQKWVRKLSPVGGGQGAGRLKFLRWVPTGECL